MTKETHEPYFDEEVEVTLGMQVSLTEEIAENYDVIVVLHKRHGPGECEGTVVLPVNCKGETAGAKVVQAAAELLSDRDNIQEQKYDA